MTNDTAILKVYKEGSLLKSEIIGGNNTSQFAQNIKFYLEAIKYIHSQEESLFNESSTFFINLHDHIPSQMDIDKLLVMSRPKGADPIKYILCPLWGFLLYNKIDNIFRNQILWECKYPMAVWYGSTTGNDKLWKYKQQETRYEVVRLSKENPDMTKAAFTNIVQFAKKRPERFDPEILEKKDSVNDLEQMRYKYIIVADGNVSTYGYFWVLASGSVPLKQESDHIQYFENDLEEYVHYVPIKKDFSDLIEKIEWLQKNDSEAKKIAENAHQYALENFTKEKFQEKMIESISKSISK